MYLDTMLQPKTPTTTETTASTTPKSISALGRRSCGLRRPSTPFVSPVMKRPYEGSSKEIYNTPKRSKQDYGNTLLKAPTDLCSKKGDQNEHSLELLARKRELIKIIQTREESLRKLKLVKMYRNKNDLTQLQSLIDKWRTVSQEAAERLLGKIHMDPQPTMEQLLSNLQVDKELIHYSEDDESFY